METKPWRVDEGQPPVCVRRSVIYCTLVRKIFSARQNLTENRRKREMGLRKEIIIIMVNAIRKIEHVNKILPFQVIFFWI